MQLYVTYGSPYARLARIVVVEKGLEDRVETRRPYHANRGSTSWIIQIQASGNHRGL